ncbi:MAG: hypothetical protein AB1763_02470 [Campylobacterota bacterium]
MDLLHDQVVQLIGSSIELSEKLIISNGLNKPLLTETELALYFGRSKNWTYQLRNKGVLHEGIHYHYINGLVLYNREKIENDIVSNNFR